MTPLLAGVARNHGYEGTSNRDMGFLSRLDPSLYPAVVAGEWVFVTNDESDFRELAEEEQLHPGLIILPQHTREQQCAWFEEILAYVEDQAAEDGEDAGIWMINRVVEYDEEAATVRHAWLPQP